MAVIKNNSIVWLTMEIERDSTFTTKTFITPMLILFALPVACFMLPPDSEVKLDIHIGVIQAYAIFSIIIPEHIAPFTTTTPKFGKPQHFIYQ